MRTHRSLPLLAAALALVAALALSGCATPPAAVSSGAPIPDAVTVRGSGTALAKPDKAELSFSVFSRETDSKTAMTKAGADGEAIVKALKAAGVDEKDLQTTGVMLQPEYAYAENQPPRVTGYRADITVKATVRDLAKLADVISAGTKAGAKSVSGPVFQLNDDNATKFTAVEKAVADAKARADAMAKAGGRSVGEVISMSDAQVAAESPWALKDAYLARAAAPMAAGGMPEGTIEPGQLEMSAEVVIVYRLK